MNKINHYLQLATPLLLGIAFGLFAWWRLMAHEALLYAAQEHSLWLSGSQFFSDMLGQPGGILSWMGCYLTQYFYHPAVGASLLILLWLCTYGLTIWSCRLRWWLCPLALLPVIMLLWAVTAPTYHIYVLKVPDWWFTPSLIALCVALLLIPFRWATKTIRLSAEVILLLSSIGYAYHWEEASQVPVSLRAPFYATADNSLFLAEQRMERAATEGDWKGVLTEFRACKQLPTRQMVTFHNAALYHTGRLLNEWGNTIRLSQLPQFPDSTIMMPMTEMCGPRLYLLHGCLQFAHRWAMEDMVEYGPQIRNLRVMAEVSLLAGDYDLVRKYAAILKRTTFHRAEAEELEQLAFHPELISKDARYRKSLILAQNQSDMLDSDDSHGEKYLWHHYSTLVNGDVAELNELCIHFSMLTQNTECFWDQFFAYAHLHRGEQMPRILQEAAYLYGTLEPGRVDISQMPFDKEVVDGHARFMKAVQAHLSMGRNEAAVGTATQREFGHTFYWFYYFVRHLETY